TVAHDVNSFIQDIQDSDIDFSKGKEITDKLNERIDNTIQRIEVIENLLREIKEQNKRDQAENPDNGNGDGGEEDQPDHGDDDGEAETPPREGEAPASGGNTNRIHPAENGDNLDQIDEDTDSALEELAALKEEL